MTSTPACWLLRALLVLATFGLSASHAADTLEYRLVAQKVADDSYVFVGAREDFSPANGGNILNTAFVVTAEGVIVIDTGATLRHGQAIREAIRAVTAKPVREVWITHHHPDHFLGNQAFADVPIAALLLTTQGIRDEGASFATNIYRLAGDWAKGTEPAAPTLQLEAGTRQVGDHRFRLLSLTGHTAADLAIFDETTGVLYAGDLVFHDRAPTTPHADPARWLASLDQLAGLPLKVLVPGHGPPTRDAAPIAQTRAWLVWLDELLRRSARAGLDPAEILDQPVPAEFASLPLARHELVRSIAHLYRGLELEMLAKPRPAAQHGSR